GGGWCGSAAWPSGVPRRKRSSRVLRRTSPSQASWRSDGRPKRGAADVPQFRPRTAGEGWPNAVLHRYDYDEQGRITDASTERHEARLAYDANGGRRLDVRDNQCSSRGRVNELDYGEQRS